MNNIQHSILSPNNADVSIDADSWHSTLMPGQTMITSPTSMLPVEGLTQKLLSHIRTLAVERDGLKAQHTDFQVQLNDQQYRLEWADEIRIFVAGLADALGISDEDGTLEDSEATEFNDDTYGPESDGASGGEEEGIRGKAEDAQLLRIARRTRRCLPSLFNLAAETASIAANGESATLFLLGRRSQTSSGYLMGSPTQLSRRSGSRSSTDIDDGVNSSNTVWTVDSSGRMTVISLAANDGTLFRQALTLEEPLLVSSGSSGHEIAHNVNSLLMYKLMDNMGRVQGLIQVVNAVGEGRQDGFNPDEVQQLTEVSSQLTVVGKLARRLNTTSEKLEYASVKVRKYRVLADRGGEVLKEDLATDILQQACRLVDAAQSFLLLGVAPASIDTEQTFDEKLSLRKGKLERYIGLHASWPLPLSNNHNKLPADRGLSAITFSSGNDLNIDDVSDEARFDEEGDAHLIEAAGKLLERKESTSLCLLSVPVRNPQTGEIIGILQAFGKYRGSKFFDEHDAKNLQAVTSSIFAVLEASMNDGSRPLPRSCLDVVSVANVANYGAQPPAISLELVGHLNNILDASDQKFAKSGTRAVGTDGLSDVAKDEMEAWRQSQAVLCEELCRVFAADSVNIYLRHVPENAIIAATQSNDPLSILLSSENGPMRFYNPLEDSRGNAAPTMYRPGWGLTGHVMSSGQSISVDDMEKSDRFSTKIDGHVGSRFKGSLLCVPLWWVLPIDATTNVTDATSRVGTSNAVSSPVDKNSKSKMPIMGVIQLTRILSNDEFEASSASVKRPSGTKPVSQQDIVPATPWSNVEKELCELCAQHVLSPLIQRYWWSNPQQRVFAAQKAASVTNVKDMEITMAQAVLRSRMLTKLMKRCNSAINLMLTEELDSLPPLPKENLDSADTGAELFHGTIESQNIEWVKNSAQILMRVLSSTHASDSVEFFLVNEKKNTFSPILPEGSLEHSTQQQGKVTTTLGQSIPLSVGIAGFVGRTEEAVVLADATKHPNFYPNLDALSNRDGYKTTIASVALRVNNPIAALLVVSVKRAHDPAASVDENDGRESMRAYTEDDVMMLPVVCRSALAMVTTTAHINKHRNFAENESHSCQEQILRAKAEISEARDEAQEAADRVSSVESTYAEKNRKLREFAVNLASWDPIEIAETQAEAAAHHHALATGRLSPSGTNQIMPEDHIDFISVGRTMIEFIEAQILKLVPAEYACLHLVDDKTHDRLWTQRAAPKFSRVKSKASIGQELNVNSDVSVARCVGGGIPICHDFADRPAGANFRADERQLSELLGQTFDRAGGPRLNSCLCFPLRLSEKKPVVAVIQLVNRVAEEGNTISHHSFSSIDTDAVAEIEPLMASVVLRWRQARDAHQMSYEANKKASDAKLTAEQEALEADAAIKLAEEGQAFAEDRAERTEAASKGTTALLEVAGQLSSGLEMERLIALASERGKEALGAQNFDVFVIDSNENELWTAEYETGYVLRISKAGIVGHVATTGDFVRTDDIFAHPRFRMDSDLLMSKGKGEVSARTFRPTASPYDRTFMCGPIKDDTGRVIAVVRVLGKLNSGNTSSRANLSNSDCFSFDHASEILTQQFCNLLANAVVGAQRKSDEAGRMYKIGKIVQELEAAGSSEDKGLPGSTESSSNTNNFFVPELSQIERLLEAYAGSAGTMQHISGLNTALTKAIAWTRKVGAQRNTDAEIDPVDEGRCRVWSAVDTFVGAITKAKYVYLYLRTPMPQGVPMTKLVSKHPMSAASKHEGSKFQVAVQGGGLVGAAYATGQLQKKPLTGNAVRLHTGSEFNAKTILCLPLYDGKERLIGILQIADFEKECDKNILDLLGGAIGAAVGEIDDVSQEELDHHHSVDSITEFLAAPSLPISLSLEKLTRELMRAALRLSNGADARVYMVDHNNNELFLRDSTEDENDGISMDARNEEELKGRDALQHHVRRITVRKGIGGVGVCAERGMAVFSTEGALEGAAEVGADVNDAIRSITGLGSGNTVAHLHGLGDVQDEEAAQKYRGFICLPIMCQSKGAEASAALKPRSTGGSQEAAEISSTRHYVDAVLVVSKPGFRRTPIPHGPPFFSDDDVRMLLALCSQAGPVLQAFKMIDDISEKHNTQLTDIQRESKEHLHKVESNAEESILLTNHFIDFSFRNLISLMAPTDEESPASREIAGHTNNYDEAEEIALEARKQQAVFDRLQGVLNRVRLFATQLLNCEYCELVLRNKPTEPLFGDIKDASKFAFDKRQIFVASASRSVNATNREHLDSDEPHSDLNQYDPNWGKGDVMAIPIFHVADTTNEDGTTVANNDPTSRRVSRLRHAREPPIAALCAMKNKTEMGRPPIFSERDQMLATLLGMFIALAIDSSERAEDMTRQVIEMKKITRDLTKMIDEAKDEETKQLRIASGTAHQDLARVGDHLELFKTVDSLAARFPRGRLSALYLLDREEGQLFRPATVTRILDPAGDYDFEVRNDKKGEKNIRRDMTSRSALSEGIVGHVARTGRVEHLLDAQSHAHFSSQLDGLGTIIEAGGEKSHDPKHHATTICPLLAIPLFDKGGRTSGVLLLVGTSAPRRPEPLNFLEKEIDVFQKLAQHVEISLARADNAKTMRVGIGRLETLCRSLTEQLDSEKLKIDIAQRCIEYCHSITMERTLGNIMRACASMAPRLVKAEQGAYYHVDTDRGDLWTLSIAADGVSDTSHEDPRRVAFGQGAVGKCASSRQNVTMPAGARDSDATALADMSMNDFVRRLDDVLCVPVFRASQTAYREGDAMPLVGVLCVQNKTGSGEFIDIDSEFLSLFARHVALALDSVENFDKATLQTRQATKDFKKLESENFNVKRSLIECEQRVTWRERLHVALHEALALQAPDQLVEWVAQRVPNLFQIARTHLEPAHAQNSIQQQQQQQFRQDEKFHLGDIGAEQISQGMTPNPHGTTPNTIDSGVRSGGVTLPFDSPGFDTPRFNTSVTNYENSPFGVTQPFSVINSSQDTSIPLKRRSDESLLGILTIDRRPIASPTRRSVKRNESSGIRANSSSDTGAPIESSSRSSTGRNHFRDDLPEETLKPQALDAAMCNELAQMISFALEILLDRREKEDAKRQEDHAKEVVSELSGQMKSWSERQDKVHAAAMAREVLSSLTAALGHHLGNTSDVCLTVASKLPGLLDAERAILYVIEDDRQNAWSVVAGTSGPRQPAESRGRKITAQLSALLKQAIGFSRAVRETVMVRKHGDEDFENFDGEYSFRNMNSGGGSLDANVGQGEIWAVPVTNPSGDVIAVLQIMSRLTELVRAPPGVMGGVFQSRVVPSSLNVAVANVQQRLNESVLMTIGSLLGLAITYSGIVSVAEEKSLRKFNEDLNSRVELRVSETEQKIVQWEALAQALQALAGDVHEAGFFAIVGSCAARVCGGERAQLFFLDEKKDNESGRVETRVWSRSIDGSREITMDLERSIPGKVIAERCVINTVREMGSRDYGSSNPMQLELGTVASVEYNSSIGGPSVSSYVLCAPIQSPLGDMLGAVEVLSSKQYKHGDEDLLTRLCAALGAAMDHSRKYHTNAKQLKTVNENLKNQQDFEEEERSKFTRQHAHEIEQRTGELKTKLLELQKMNDELHAELGAERSAKERLHGSTTDINLEAKMQTASRELQAKNREIELGKLQIEAFIRETKILKSENVNLVRDKEDALAKLNTYRKHVKRARRAMELSMVEEESKTREDNAALEDLQQNLKTTQEQMISLQQQYAQMVEEKDASFESNRNLQDQLSAAQHQTARLRRQQEMLHGKLRSLARLESAQAQAATQQERSISPKRSSPTLKAHNLEH